MTEQAHTESETEGERIALLAACLHASYTAENHANLAGEVTRLLLHLSREPSRSESGIGPPAAVERVGAEAAGPRARFSFASLAIRFPGFRP